MDKINNKLIRSTIKGLEVLCFVVTEDQLENQQRENIFGDIFSLIAALLLGAAISSIYPSYILLLFLLGSMMLFFAIWYKYLKYNLIKKLKKSPEVKYIDFEEGNNIIEIIKSVYGSDTQSVDVTEKIKSKIQNNKLDMLVLNEELGCDPHKGVNKTLEIIYSQNGKIITKKVGEYKRIIIP